MYGWLCGNALMLRLVNKVEWEVHDTTNLNKKGWHMVIRNHQSWADIVLLGDIFRNRLPTPKFFKTRSICMCRLSGWRAGA